MDNLDHIRPTTGVASWDAPSQWNLPGRAFPSYASGVKPADHPGYL